MKIFRIATVAWAVAMLAGCTYDATKNIEVAQDIRIDAESKLPGRFALYVENTVLQGEFFPPGPLCPGMEYPVDLRAGFTGTLEKAMRDAVEEIVFSELELTPQGIAARGLDGQIRVTATRFLTRMDASVYGANMTFHATAGIDVLLVVTTSRGEALTFELGTKEKASAWGGLFCEGGADAGGAASNKAIRDIVERLAEKVAATPDLRQSARLER